MTKNKFIFIMATIFINLTIICCVPVWAEALKKATYANNISPLLAYDKVHENDGNTYLIDVRSPEEYQLIGHSAVAYNVPFKFLSDRFVVAGEEFKGKPAKKTMYQFYKNKDFLSYMKYHFKRSDTLLIMCKSGARSTPASDFLVKNGFTKVYNVLGGFEGLSLKGENAIDKKLLHKYSSVDGNLGLKNGWRYYGLPWTYKMNSVLVYDLHK